MATLIARSIDGMTPFGFDGTNRNQILDDQFTGLTGWGGEDDHWSVVADADGDYIRTRSEVHKRNVLQFEDTFTNTQETYLAYQFRFEAGYDFGDSLGLRRVWETGIKMPGLANAPVGSNVNSQRSADGYTARLMVHGTRKNADANGAAGAAHEPRQGVTLSSYIYASEYQGVPESGSGRSFYFKQGDPFPTTNFHIGNGNTGTGQGCGHPDIWDLPDGEWVWVVVGVRCDGANGWFRCWTQEQGDSVLQERLEVTGIEYMQTSGQGTERLLFSTFHGGPDYNDSPPNSQYWHPDVESYINFRRFLVATTFAEMQTHIDSFSAPATAFEITSPADGATDVATPVTFTGTADNTDSPLLRVMNLTDSTVYDGASFVADADADQDWQPVSVSGGAWSYGPVSIANGKSCRAKLRK